MNGIKILGTGHGLPAKILTNEALSGFVDTSDEWITSRTGIRQRHCCTTESQTQLCTQAAAKALKNAGIDPREIGVCIVATMTPETIMPSTACMLQQELGLGEDTLCFDLNAACSGFVFALHTMECLLNGSARRYGLVVGGEAMSRVVNWSDRSSCILFGDGAGAVVVECREGWPSIGAVTGCHGNDRLLRCGGVGSEKDPFITMEGTKVFKFAVEAIPYCIEQVLAHRGMGAEDVDQFILHQANARIIDSVVRKCGIPAEKCPKNLSRYGNTSAASIPLLLSELWELGQVHSGSRCLLVGFGGGLTWGGALIEFA